MRYGRLKSSTTVYNGKARGVNIHATCSESNVCDQAMAHLIRSRNYKECRELVGQTFIFSYIENGIDMDAIELRLVVDKLNLKFVEV